MRRNAVGVGAATPAPWCAIGTTLLIVLLLMTLFLMALLGGVASAAESPQPPAPAAAKDKPSLDDQLLKSLSDDLLKDLEALPAAKKPDGESRPGGSPSAKDLDRQLLKDLDAGEDVGQGPQDPLVSIGRRMRAAEELIARRNTSDPTQKLQKQIVAELDELLEQLKKQCSSGQCSSSGQKQSGKPGAGSQKQGTGNAQAAKSPAKDSESRVGKPPNDAVDAGARKRTLEELWGQLPPKLREQLQASATEQFLPQYEKLIEEYFKRLAEERRER